MTYRAIFLMPIRLQMALVASALLHLLVVLTPIFGTPKMDEVATKLQPTARVMHVSLSRRGIARDELLPSQANGIARRFSIIDDAPIALVLSRQPALIGSTVDDTVDIPEGMETHGDLLLQIFLDRFGRPTSVRILKSSMQHDIEESVVQRFFKAKYHPGEVNGLPVNSNIILSISLSANLLLPNGQ